MVGTKVVKALRLIRPIRISRLMETLYTRLLRIRKHFKLCMGKRSTSTYTTIGKKHLNTLFRMELLILALLLSEDAQALAR